MGDTVIFGLFPLECHDPYANDMNEHSPKEINKKDNRYNL